MIYFPFSFAPLVYHNTDIHYFIPCLYCILLLWYTDLFHKIILYSTIMIYMFPNIIAFCISQYWYTRTHMAAELYITIMIYFFISFFYSVYHNTDTTLHLTTKIVYHNSDIRFSHTFSPVLKISAVPLVRRFFFTLFCCEMALLLGFGCETTPFLRFRSPFHYTWHFRLWCGFTTPSSGWEYPFYSPFAPLSYPLQYWYLSLTNAFIVELLY